MTRWLVRSASDVRALLNTNVTTKIKHVLGTCAVAFVVFGLVFWMIREGNRHDRTSDRRAAAEASYNAEVRAYDAQIAQIDACESRLVSRADITEIFQGQNAAAHGQNTAIRRILNLTVAAATAAGRPPSPILDQAFAELDAQDALVAEQDTKTAAYAATSTPCNIRPPAPVKPESMSASG